MTPARADLLVQRGRLLERIRQQRCDLTRQIAPLAQLATLAEQALDRVRNGVRQVRQHPQVALLVTALMLILGPRRALRHARSALLLWRGWRWVRSQL